MTDHPTPPTSPNPPTRAVCGSRVGLPTHLVVDTLRLAPLQSGELDPVQRELRCVLEEHHDGPHHGLVRELDGADTGSVWAPWHTGAEPAGVVRLADCDADSAGGAVVCEEFAGHPGGHTWQMADPWRNAEV